MVAKARILQLCILWREVCRLGSLKNQVFSCLLSWRWGVWAERYLLWRKILLLDAIDHWWMTFKNSLNLVLSLVMTNYSSNLTRSHPTFSRFQGSGSTYYYEAIEVIANVNGVYSFESKSSTDLYGYFYHDYFYWWNPSVNLIQSNDDSGTSAQFLLTALNIENSKKYILVVTTFGANVITQFSVIGSGPGDIRYQDITPPASSGTTPTMEIRTTTASKLFSVTNS